MRGTVVLLALASAAVAAVPEAEAQTRPGTPTGLQATAVSSTQIDFSWTASAARTATMSSAS